MASPKFQFSSPGRRTWGIFNPCTVVCHEWVRKMTDVISMFVFQAWTDRYSLWILMSSKSPMRFPHTYVKSSVGITLINRMFMLTTFPTFLTLQVKHNIRTLSLNIKFICTRCETGLKSSLFCLFLVRVTLVPVSYLSAPSAVHSYRVPGKFIRRLKSLFV
jgi:hypothetical protein